MKRRFVLIPGFVMGPERVFELMLDIEKPDADRCPQQRDRQFDQQKRTHPMNRMTVAMRIAIARFVPMVLNHGCHPARTSPSGRRYCKMNK